MLVSPTLCQSNAVSEQFTKHSDMTSVDGEAAEREEVGRYLELNWSSY